MKKIPWRPVLLYVLLDVFVIGVMGMGVPFFCILLGIPAGWVLAGRLFRQKESLAEVIRGILVPALWMTAFSALVLVLIWMGPTMMLFDPTADLANFGIPMILFTPLASFIGWMILMMVISPGLQFLMILFGFFARLWWLLGPQSQTSIKEQ